MANPTTVGTPVTGNGTRASGAAITVNKPTGVTTNDVLFFVVGLNGNTPTWTLPSGWTQDHQNTANAEPLMVAHKVAGSSEPSSYSFTPTQSGSVDGGWGITAIRGLDTTTPVLAVSSDGADGGNTTSHTAPSVSWTGATSAVSMIIGTWQAGSATVTWPSGWNSSTDGFNTDDTFEACVVGCNLTATGSVTSLASQTYTTSVGVFGESNQLALKVAASGTTTNQALTVSSTSTATILKSVQKGLTTSATSTATILKTVQKALTVTGTSTATILKTVLKVLSAIDTETATLIGLVTRQLVMTATSTSTATLTAQKIGGQILSASSTSTATISAHVIQGTFGRPTDLWRQEYGTNASGYSNYSDVFRQTVGPQEDSWVVRLREFGRRFF